MKIKSNNFICLMIQLILVSQFANYCSSEAKQVTGQHFRIGVLLSIRPNNKDFTCYGNVVSSDTQQILEALYFAVDMIQKDEKLLPNVTLELVIEDFCSNMEVGRAKIMELLENSFCLIGKTEDLLSCSSNDTKPALLGVILPRDTQSEIEHILHGYRIPQIIYTDPKDGILENIEENSAWYFSKSDIVYSLSSGNVFMTDVIFEILAHFNWTYVALVHSSVGFHNVNILKRFKSLASSYKVCIADIVDTLQTFSMAGHIVNLWDIMPSYDTVDVIVCFCDEIELEFLHEAIKGNGKSGYKRTKKFVIISGNVKGQQPRTKKNFVPSSAGISVSIRPQYIKEFDDYFLSRTVQNNQRNPWFKEFWEQYFKCRFQPKGNETKCEGNENLMDGYKQYESVPNAIKAVHVLAHALHNMLASVEKHDLIFDYYFNRFLRTSVSQVNFSLFDEEISFDNGLPTMVKYDIHQSQFLNGSSVPLKIGEYVKSGETYNEESTAQHDFKEFEKLLSKPGTLRIRGALRMHDNISFPFKVKSSCSETCPLGYATIKRNDICCWDCKRCNSLEILINGTLCAKCEFGYMANLARNKCLPIPFKNSTWYDTNRLVSMSFSLVSITLTLFTFTIFIKYKNTPVVKSSTKELCYVMFVGMVLANITPFIVALPKKEITCAMIRITPSITFTMIYAALLVKTNRIARLLAISKKKFPNMNPKFMTLKAQVAITFLLIGAGILICLISLFRHPPQISIDYKEKDNGWIGSKTCHLDKDILFETFAFVAILVVLCTHYAAQTRNLPENFNEAKCIGFTMYATLLTGTAFALIYFNSDKKILSINMSVSINSLIILSFLFAPKLYIILCKPTKNTRANFTTSRNVRSYLGKVKWSDTREEAPSYSLKEEKPNPVKNSIICAKFLAELMNLLDTLYLNEKESEKLTSRDDSKLYKILEHLHKNQTEVQKLKNELKSS